VPGWLRPEGAALRVNGLPVVMNLVPGTYAEITRKWRAGDIIEFNMDFRPTLWEANPLVEEALNQVAIKSGPLVYCIEADDLPAGVRVRDVMLSLLKPTEFVTQREKISTAHLQTLSFSAHARERQIVESGALYLEVAFHLPRPISLKAVPYFAWGNRGDTDMSVWLPAR
jgi:DUF1680 family protein